MGDPGATLHLPCPGTAGFELVSEGASMLIDPYLSRHPRSLPARGPRPGDFPHDPAFIDYDWA
ncbi:MAG: hypothetical protein H5T73_01830 [Actinobacteria bacterium]|nr:hypothetical protein [Actinomycetota bacterium]